MGARELMRGALVAGVMYGGYLALAGRPAQASLADDFFADDGAPGAFNPFGDFGSGFGDTFAFDEPLFTDQASVSQGSGLFDFFSFGDVFSGVTFGADEVAASGIDLDTDTVARTIWGEARGGGASAMAAVASVIMNRVRDPRWPSSPREVALEPAQFSTWNAGDPNGPKARAATSSTPAFSQALSIAKNAVSGALRDSTGGATHFYASTIAPPLWSYGGDVSARIGGHVFLTGVA